MRFSWKIISNLFRIADGMYQHDLPTNASESGDIASALNALAAELATVAAALNGVKGTLHIFNSLFT